MNLKDRMNDFDPEYSFTTQATAQDFVKRSGFQSSHEIVKESNRFVVRRKRSGRG